METLCRSNNHNNNKKATSVKEKKNVKAPWFCQHVERLRPLMKRMVRPSPALPTNGSAASDPVQGAAWRHNEAR